MAMKEFEREKDILNGVERAKDIQQKDKSKLCDWQDEEDKALLRQDSRVAERKRVLDVIVPTRVCPSCHRRIFMDSHWVVEKKLAWCRSCFHSNHKVSDDEVSGSIITRVVLRVEFDGWKIKTMRHKMGVGAQAFADKCGWTKPYQEQIERNAMKSLSLEAITTIIQVFENLGVIIIDAI